MRRLEGVPAEVLANPALMSLAMPALRADTRLYRNYLYRPEEPLATPILAYGGDADPNVSRDQLGAWREQTSTAFGHTEFAGGHFFIQSARAEFLAALGDGLNPGSVQAL